MRKALLSIVATAFALTGLQLFAANERFMSVLEKGKIVVGVKADYKPWGFRNESGEIVGMEVDMAQDVADALGVELELVAVQSSNRMQFLEQGKIDLMIATMSDRDDRRKDCRYSTTQLLYFRHQCTGTQKRLGLKRLGRIARQACLR